jgi:hypothetical protein
MRFVVARIIKDEWLICAEFVMSFDAHRFCAYMRTIESGTKFEVLETSSSKYVFALERSDCQPLY